MILERKRKQKFHPENIIGKSKRMADVYASLEVASRSRMPVMLRGENGTEKELIARAIHNASDCAKGPFIKVSCSAFPGVLIEKKLFGDEEIFLGQTDAKESLFEKVKEGTLFLDEIDEMSLSTQTKLVNIPIRNDIRLITATNKDLEAKVKTMEFREDLYYFLNVFAIYIPALRERKEDIPLLSNQYLQKLNNEYHKNVQGVAEDALEYLMSYFWPGNIHELENVLKRAYGICTSSVLTRNLLRIPRIYGNFFEKGTLKRRNLPEALENLEKQMIENALEDAGGNQRKAAQLLGITQRIMGYRLKRYKHKNNVIVKEG